MLGERLWRSRFNADPAIVGKPILLDQQACTVVGVMPATFKTPPESPAAELWLTLTHDPVFGDLSARRGGHYLRIVGRLKPGTPIARAQAELAAIQRTLARDYPKENEGWGARLMPLSESLVGGARTALLVLLAAVGLVFGIACVNVANLLLARATARSREVAIRCALGAGRGRLLRQFLAEGLVLALGGGALGLAAAVASLRALRAWLPPDLPRVGEIRLDGVVLLFALAISLVSAIVFGLVPAFHASSADLSARLKAGARGRGRKRREQAPPEPARRRRDGDLVRAADRRRTAHAQLPAAADGAARFRAFRASSPPGCRCPATSTRSPSSGSVSTRGWSSA